MGSTMTMIHRFTAAAAMIALLGAGCGASAPSMDSPTPSLPSAVTPSGPLTLTSTAFTDGQAIPEKYTCNGQDFSPPVAFGNIPADTISLALIVEDKDAPYDHWIVFNIAPSIGGIPEGDIPPGTVGTSVGDKLGYAGPCPPEGQTHTYAFTLYALNRAIYLADGAVKADVLKEMEGKIISQATLNGTYAGK